MTQPQRPFYSANDGRYCGDATGELNARGFPVPCRRAPAPGYNRLGLCEEHLASYREACCVRPPPPWAPVLDATRGDDVGGVMVYWDLRGQREH